MSSWQVGGLFMQRNFFIPVALSTFSLLLSLLPASAIDSGDKSTVKRHRSHHRSYGLVPPPPPTAVSPTVLAMYPLHGMGASHFMPKKPRNLAEEMKLTAVMDDIAFFKLNGNEQSVHLKAGNMYESVTVAQINPDQVVLEEKGTQYIKRLK